MSKSDLAAANRLIDSVVAADLEGAVAAMHSEVVVKEPESLPYGGEWSGLDGFQKLLETMMTHYQVVINSYQSWDAGEGTVIMRAEATFTANSTRKSLNTHIVEIYTIKDDRIAVADIYPKDAARQFALHRADQPVTTVGDGQQWWPQPAFT